MKRQQKGFTLIELIIVIIILGILAAFIIPRFGALDKQARIAVVNGMAGSLRGASAIAHGLYLTGPSGAGSVSMDGTTVSIANQYPTTNDTTGIISALNTSYNSSNSTISSFLYNTSTSGVAFCPTSSSSNTAATCTYALVLTNGASTCGVGYSNTGGTVIVDTTGC